MSKPAQESLSHANFGPERFLNRFFFGRGPTTVPERNPTTAVRPLARGEETFFLQSFYKVTSEMRLFGTTIKKKTLRVDTDDPQLRPCAFRDFLWVTPKLRPISSPVPASDA
jgi:hypothetical protein